MTEKPTYEIIGDSTGIDKAIDELRSYLKSEKGLFELFLDRFNIFDELIEIEFGPTIGTRMTGYFKPSKLFLDLLAAGRAGDIKGFIVRK